MLKFYLGLVNLKTIIMSEETLDNSQGQENKRPTLLTVLCILTWIASGLNALAYLILVVAGAAMADLLSNVPGLGAMLTAGMVFLILILLAFVAKIIGAAQMWKMKKMGFYMYAIGEIVVLGASYMVVKDVPAEMGGGFPILAALFSAVFIALYGMNLKKMN